MIRHKSTAFVDAYEFNLRTGRDSIVSPQFRFVIRAAVAAHDAGIPYEMRWWSVKGTKNRMAVTFEAVIPPSFSPRALPKLKLAKLRPDWRLDWKPRMFEAEYRLDAYVTKGRKAPGFVITHSSGLSLVKPSGTGEWDDGDGADARQGWRVIHTASGMGFGVDLSFNRAVRALLETAGVIDWILKLFQRMA